MTKCRWDREFADYLQPDGTVCRWDDYGDPTRHCTARISCANHIGQTEFTCARCINRARNNIRRITDLAPLMLPVALGAGVNSEAAMLAGPAADPEAWSWRRIAAAQQGIPYALLEDDDEHHPYSVLTRWEFMLREDYNDPRDDETSVTRAADYLNRTLHRVAQDNTQDFPLMARELKACRNHLEAVLRNSNAPERGAPCPACAETFTGDKKAPKLTRRYGHWCDDPDCEQQFHYATITDPETGQVVPDTAGDWWECPRNHDHQWSHEDYKLRVDEWYDETRDGRMGA